MVLDNVQQQWPTATIVLLVLAGVFAIIFLGSLIAASFTDELYVRVIGYGSATIAALLFFAGALSIKTPPNSFLEKFSSTYGIQISGEKEIAAEVKSLQNNDGGYTKEFLGIKDGKTRTYIGEVKGDQFNLYENVSKGESEYVLVPPLNGTGEGLGEVENTEPKDLKLLDPEKNDGNIKDDDIITMTVEEYEKLKNG